MNLDYEVTATGLEPRTTQFSNEHSTIWPNWFWVRVQLLGNAFIDSQLNYAPLICTFCQKTTYLRSKGYTKRRLELFTCHTPLIVICQNAMVVNSIHQRHLQFLLTEIYKNNVTPIPRFTWHFFREREVPYNLRKGAVLLRPPAKLTTHGTNIAHLHGTLIWNLLPDSTKIQLINY